MSRCVLCWSALLFGLLFATTSCSNKSDFSLEQALTKPNAKLYQDVVNPLLQAKCVQCHGNDKQKGKLRLDLPEFISKGGKGGKTVVAGNSNDSELIYHLQLPLDDEDHMPPKEEEQLAASEIELLMAWIDTGAKYEGSVSSLLNEKQLAKLTSQPETSSQDFRDTQVVGANPNLLQKLSEEGVAVVPVEAGSNFLAVSFISVPDKAAMLLKELSSIKENIVSLKLSGCAVNDSAIILIKDFTNLKRLSLDGTHITDSGLAAMKNLTSLNYLNLKGSPVSVEGILKLNDLKKLKNLYLYQTQVLEKDQSIIKSLFPFTQVDFGNYDVPTLTWDTTQVKGERPEN